jgi:hypothetical protein
MPKINAIATNCFTITLDEDTNVMYELFYKCDYNHK